MKFLSIKVSIGFQIFLALTLGCLCGVYFGPQILFVGQLGLIIIKVLKTLAIPLVFFAILDAFCTTEIPFRQGIRLLGFSFRNALVALVISLSLARMFPVGRFMDVGVLSGLIGSGENLSSKQSLDILNKINIVYVVIVALAIGILSRLFKQTPLISAFVSKAFKFTISALKIVVRFIPLAVFAVVAKIVGGHGFRFFSALALFVMIVTLGILIHVFVYYSLLLFLSLKKSPFKFFSDASAPLLTAFGTGSSLATLPVTLETLQEKMKVSASSARLAACIGTNLNHDGILLYEVTGAFFIAQIQGINLTLTQQITVATTSIMAAVGIAGVPEAGFISLSVVLGAAGLSLSAVPFLLPVDWFLGRLRAFANVASDMIVAQLLDKS